MRRAPHTDELFARLERPQPAAPPPPPPWEELDAGGLTDAQVDSFLASADGAGRTRGNPPSERQHTREGLEKLMRAM